MAKINLVLWKYQQNADKTYPLYLRIYKDKKIKLISIGYSVFEKDWDEKAKQVKSTHKNASRVDKRRIKRTAFEWL